MRTDTSIGHKEFVGVVMLGNHYLAMHFQGSNKFFISKQAEADIKVAQSAAMRFADEKKLCYHNDLFYSDRSIITILRYRSRWYPAEISDDQINLVMDIVRLDPLDLAGSKRGAIYYAHHISRTKSCYLMSALRHYYNNRLIQI